MFKTHISFFKIEELLHFFIIPSFIGLIGGFSAYIFRFLIKFFADLYEKINFSHSDIFTLFFIPIYFYLSFLIIKTVLKELSDITIDQIVKKISLFAGNFSFIKGFLAMFLTSASIGFGIPVGREAPIAKLGGFLTEIFISLAKIPRINIPIYLSAGVSSALSATFNAPIAGIFFGIEIILGRVNTYIIIPLMVASSVSTLIAREFIGYYTAFYVPYLKFDEKYIYLLPLASIFFGLISIFINSLLRYLKNLKNCHYDNWSRFVIISGVIVAIILYFLPETRGVGYSYITDLFQNKFTSDYVLSIMIGKIIAVILTIGSGLFGGLMSPSIFIGAFGGYWFGSLFDGVDPRVFALIGTASILGGISRAPMRSTIIIIELTHSYQLLIPTLLTSAFTSFLLSKFDPASYFRRTLIQKGIDIDNPVIIEFFKKLKYDEFLDKVKPINENDLLYNVLNKYQKYKINYLPVVNNDNVLVGVLSLRDVRKRWIYKFNMDMYVKDFMSKKPFYLSKNSSYEDLLKAISLLDVSHIPFVDENKKYIGMFNILKLLQKLSFIEAHCKVK